MNVYNFDYCLFKLKFTLNYKSVFINLKYCSILKKL